MEERQNGASVSYVYDKAGNRVRKTDAQGVTMYRFNRKNQLIEEESGNGKNQFTYDKQGGIVKEKNPVGNRLFSYNSRHQQTRVETESGNVQENRYDAENLRFELVENGRRTSFVYHNGELLHEEGGIEKQISYHLGAGIDALQRGKELSYYHRDEQLSTAFITGRHGEIQNSYLYDAFGAEIETNEQFPNRIRYTGQQYDEFSEQYYLRARYYNPILGRFMQEDVYQGDGLNLYAYCRNNPVVYWDPSGYDSNTATGDFFQDVLDHFYKWGGDTGIFSSNNSWNSFQQIVGGQNFSRDQIAAAYNELLRINADGHYIHRNNLSKEFIDILQKQPVAGYKNKSYDDLIKEGILLDIGHKKDWEFWRTRNAAENLGWTQAQYDEFMTHDLIDHYQYEDHKINISHVNENHSSDVSDIEKEMLKYQKEQEDNGNWKRKEDQTDQNAQSSCRGGKK